MDYNNHFFLVVVIIIKNKAEEKLLIEAIFEVESHMGIKKILTQLRVVSKKYCLLFTFICNVVVYSI